MKMTSKTYLENKLSMKWIALWMNIMLKHHCLKFASKYFLFNIAKTTPLFFRMKTLEYISKLQTHYP